MLSMIDTEIVKNWAIRSYVPQMQNLLHYEGCDTHSEVTHASDLETTCSNFPPSLTAQGTLTTMHV